MSRSVSRASTHGQETLGATGRNNRKPTEIVAAHSPTLTLAVGRSLRMGEAVGSATVAIGIASFVSSIAMGTNLLSSMDVEAPVGPDFGPDFEDSESDFEPSSERDELVMKLASFLCISIT